MRAVIEDSVKREVVSLLQNGWRAVEVAERCGVNLQTIYSSWRKWEEDIMRELPDTVKPFVKAADVAIDPPDEEPVPEEPEVEEAKTEEPKAEPESEDVSVAEVKQSGRKDHLDGTVNLIKAVDKLLCEYLEAGNEIASLEINVDDGNRVEFSAGYSQSTGKQRAQLCVWVTLDEEE